MRPEYAVGVVLLIGIIVTLILNKRAGKQSVVEDSLPYYAKKVMSKPEQALYYRLTAALPDHIVLAQVQLSRFLGVKQGYPFHEWNNKINRMSADFLICNKDSRIVAVIELDDNSHKSEKRQQADEKKDRAIKAAGLTVIRWNVQNMPDSEKIREQLGVC